MSALKISDLLEHKVRYHGSIAKLHGPAVVDEVCGSGKADDPCDQLIRHRERTEDLRWVLRFRGGGELHHVRYSSFTLIDENGEDL